MLIAQILPVSYDIDLQEEQSRLCIDEVIYSDKCPSRVTTSRYQAETNCLNESDATTGV